jgi:signal transduction histidine kinase
VRLWVSIFSDVTELKKTQEALLAEHRKGQQRLERIQEMAEGLFAIGLMPFAQATQQVAEVARRVTGADQAAFYPLDEAAQSFGPPIIAPAGARPFFTRNVDSLLGPVSSGVTRHSVHVPDTLADELWRDLAGTSLSLYATAVTFTDHHMGMLVLVSRGPGRVSEEERYLADTVAAYGGTILENARLYQQIGTLAAESERTRISHELHDGLAQVLGYVNTQAQAVEIYLEKGDVGEAREQLRSLSAAARRAYQDVRQGMMDIRASTRPGHTFKEALEEYLAYFHMRWGTQLQVTYDITPDVAALLPAQEVQVLRVVQEAMANARKHSRASSVVVRLARLDDRLRVEVIDNGTGFNPDAVPKGGLPRLGVTTMRERAIAVGGSLEIDSAPGRGTRVRLDVPLARTEATMEVRV